MATVLLIGKRTPVQDELTEIVEGNGHFVVRANDFPDMEIMDLTHIDIVLFGKMLTNSELEELRAKGRQKNPSIVFIRGLAPIPELMAIQINAELTARRHIPDKPVFDRHNQHVIITLSAKQSVRVTVWWVSIFYRPKVKVVMETSLQAGMHTVVMPTWSARQKCYVTVEIGKHDAFVV